MTCGVESVEARSRFAGALELFLKIAFKCVFFRFWSDFGRFWEAKMEAKIDFWEVFRDVFFDRVLESIFL